MTYKLKTAEKEWADSFMGKRIDVRPWTNGAKQRLKGTVIDYKPDTVGMGVFFVCELDRPNRFGDRHEESYRTFPARINQRVRQSRSIRRRLTYDARTDS